MVSTTHKLQISVSEAPIMQDEACWFAKTWIKEPPMTSIQQTDLQDHVTGIWKEVFSKYASKIVRTMTSESEKGTM